ncbi:hypothetical protein Taro_052467 [Colocasia esculenta]|uniref:CCHC-type domain-containing protein n=1 Tax=Colocasia esculenta TaxID=4460 RepID=A0A843XJR8_COLES|nr:hypothetical protein [Colocasia esculenta]
MVSLARPRPDRGRRSRVKLVISFDQKWQIGDIGEEVTAVPVVEEAVPAASILPPVGVEVPPVVPVVPAVPARPASAEETTALVERFLRLQPPTYSGGPNPDTAEHWIHEIERVFVIMRCPPEDKVILATYRLRGFAQEWWRLKLQTVYAGRTEDRITWAEFLASFNDTFFPVQIHQAKREQFRTLQQEKLSVLEYQMRFMALSRYAPYVVSDSAMMVEYFIRGLRLELQDAVAPLMCRTVEEAAQRAAVLERTFQGVSKGKAPSGASSSGISKWGKQIKKFFQGGRGRGRQHGFQQGRGHRPPIPEESQQSTTGQLYREVRCYSCGQLGHYARDCPSRGYGYGRGTHQQQ